MTSDLLTLIMHNQYLQLFVLSLFIVGINVVGFLEKIKGKINAYKDSIDTSIERDFSGNSFNAKQIVGIYERIKKREEQADQVESNIKVNLWTGIGFLIICLIGFGISYNDKDTSIVVFLLLLDGFIFIASFLSLIYWHVNN